METYITLLRGINVSGQKKIKMTDLKTLYEKLGFQDVQTYIQTGQSLLKKIFWLKPIFATDLALA